MDAGHCQIVQCKLCASILKTCAKLPDSWPLDSQIPSLRCACTQAELPRLPSTLMAAVVTCLFEARASGLAPYSLRVEAPKVPDGLLNGKISLRCKDKCIFSFPFSFLSDTK